MKELLAKHADDLVRGSLMLGTGAGGWLVSNIGFINELTKLAVGALTIIALLIQIALAIHKHRKDK